MTTVWVWVFGIILPLVTWGIESSSHMCAHIFFDPVPTSIHSLLILSVPGANLAMWLTWAGRARPTPRLVGWLTGVAFVVALFYTVLFLPLMPLAAVMVLAWGWGLLPLSPCLSVLALWVNWRRYRKDRADQVPSLARLVGFFSGLGLLVAAQVPLGVTRMGLEMARSPDQVVHDRGLWVLRTFGDRQAMLRACYQESTWTTDLTSMLIAWGSPVRTDEARRIFYLATGSPFNSQPPPPLEGLRWMDDWEFDDDQAGESVGGKIRGLELLRSELHCDLDATSAVQYTEWDMVFANQGARNAEARALLRMPPKGLVVRATLWVKDQPREAAFALRAKARTAYESVVATQRDPLLVTTSGPDQVMVQCFPVPPHQEMHIRLGILAPLTMESLELGRVKLPALVERNFGVAAGHAVTLESTGPVECGLDSYRCSPQGSTWQGRFQVGGDGLVQPGLTFWVRRAAGLRRLWAKDPKGGFVTADLELNPNLRPSRIWIVLDGSARVQPYLVDLARGLRAYAQQPAGEIPVGVMLADSGPRVLLAPGPPARLADLANRLAEMNLVGGKDNVKTLEAALEKDSVVIWVHALQPVDLSPVHTLEAALAQARLIALPLGAGPNRVMRELGEHPNLSQVDREGSLERDLPRVLRDVSAPASWRWMRAHADRQPDGTPGSPSLVPLWAASEVRRWIADGKLEPAGRLAVQYRLVTPASGAVVLESREQEEQQGLESADPNDIPTVPEPPMVLLLLVAGLVAGLTRRRRP